VHRRRRSDRDRRRAAGALTLGGSIPRESALPISGVASPVFADPALDVRDVDAASPARCAAAPVPAPSPDAFIAGGDCVSSARRFCSRYLFAPAVRANRSWSMTARAGRAGRASRRASWRVATAGSGASLARAPGPGGAAEGVGESACFDAAAHDGRPLAGDASWPGGRRPGLRLPGREKEAGD
jgi:hypothetical protein